MRFNYGWRVTFLVWAATPIFFITIGLMANIDKMAFSDSVVKNVVYNSLFMFFFTLILWLPAGYRASKIYRKKGKKAALVWDLKILLIVCVLVMMISSIMWY